MDKNAQKLRDINPCTDESDASQKCLNAYNYDKSMCSAYFQRYKNCRKYWVKGGKSQIVVFIHGNSEQHNVMVQRRRQGVKPDMPTPAERQEMLAAIGGKPY